MGVLPLPLSRSHILRHPVPSRSCPWLLCHLSPIDRGLSELFNEGHPPLRAYTLPLHLSRFLFFQTPSCPSFLPEGPFPSSVDGVIKQFRTHATRKVFRKEPDTAFKSVLRTIRSKRWAIPHRITHLWSTTLELLHFPCLPK